MKVSWDELPTTAKIGIVLGWLSGIIFALSFIAGMIAGVIGK